MTAKGIRGSRSDGIIQRGAATLFHGCDGVSLIDCTVFIGLGIPPKVNLRARLPAAADGSLPQWPAWSSPLAAYSKGRGLPELLRFYVCGLQARPSVRFS